MNKKEAVCQWAEYKFMLQELKSNIKKNEINQFCTDGTILDGGFLQKAMEGNERLEKQITFMRKQLKLRNKIGPLARQGIYRYDRSEQFDDGDQSPLSHDEASRLKALCATSMDWYPDISYLSPLSKCLMLGDYEGMMDLIGEKQGEELRKLLESRDTYLKVPAIFHVVRGVLARHSGESEWNWGVATEEKRYTHGICFMKLLELGVNVNARTVVGDTLLFLCVLCDGSGRACDEALIMAEILLQRGLNVNERNRVGETALFNAYNDDNVKAIKLLLAHGIDISIAEHVDDYSVAYLAREDPGIQRLFSEQTQLMAERKRMFKEIFKSSLRRDIEKEAKGSLKAAFTGVLKSVGLIWNRDQTDLVTDQGESGTCVAHALTKAAKLSLSEQNLNNQH